ncbi:MAG: XdhC family protein, partial [Chloroflexota bacterium]|nr:XdhC family protein [Chloroflexota bacterium]MED5450566.1 XdhC family protein [Chloroflexota bacterium]
RLFITDDREEFANPDRFPEADIILSETPEVALPKLPINPNTFIVVATRGHRYDNVALLAAAKTSAKYVGLMGSKRKTILIYEDLIREGLEYERLNEIRSPIGLDIRARTPEEIAVSIMSEILMFRLGGSGAPMKLDKKQIDRIRNKVDRDSKSFVEAT